MNINAGPGLTGLQHMAARSQETRKSAGVAESAEAAGAPVDSTPTVPPSGGNLPPAGENLPAADAAQESAPEPDHTTGLAHAIEMLRQNALKSPEAKGLQHALEMLQRNKERHTVDTQA